MPDDPKVTNPNAGNPPEKSGSDAGGGNLTDWRSGLPQELQKEKVFESIKGKDWLEAGPVLAKNYHEQSSLVGRSIQIPGENAKPGEWDRVYGKLGRPETPDKYEIRAPETPAGSTSPAWDPKVLGEFRQTAWQLGLTAKQVAGVTEFYSRMVSPEQVIEQAHRDGQKALKAEWGAKYEYNASLANRGAEYAGGPDLVALLEASGYGSHPVVVKAFAKIGADLAEDGQIVADERGNIMGPAEAQSELAKIHNDRKHPYFIREHAGHKAAVERVRELTEIVYG